MPDTTSLTVITLLALLVGLSIGLGADPIPDSLEEATGTSEESVH